MVDTHTCVVNLLTKLQNDVKKDFSTAQKVRFAATIKQKYVPFNRKTACVSKTKRHYNITSQQQQLYDQLLQKTFDGGCGVRE